MILKFQCESSRVWADTVSGISAFSSYFLVQTDSDKNNHKEYFENVRFFYFQGFSCTHTLNTCGHTHTQMIFCYF